MRKTTAYFFLLAVLSAGFSLSGIEQTLQGHRYEVTIPVRQTIEMDKNEDGKVDYVLFIDAKGYKIVEQLDFNFDGLLDDFYYYHNDVLKMREIDSNYDGKIDIWVYIHKGVYIQRVEQDKDFDGKVDHVLDYAID